MTADRSQNIDFLDSQVFAEEVEPTGAVPMELSLERYRYAALPNKFKDNSTNEDKRLQPRKLFNQYRILSKQDEDTDPTGGVDGQTPRALQA